MTKLEKIVIAVIVLVLTWSFYMIATGKYDPNQKNCFTSSIGEMPGYCLMFYKPL